MRIILHLGYLEGKNLNKDLNLSREILVLTVMNVSIMNGHGLTHGLGVCFCAHSGGLDRQKEGGSAGCQSHR